MSPPIADDRDLRRFDRLTFADFRKMANDDSLSQYQKIGFPDAYRAGAEGAIFDDIVSKLAPLRDREKRVLDIGPGCSGLPHMLLDLCARHGHDVTFVDSAEMLAQIPDSSNLTKRPGAFPSEVDLRDASPSAFDAILSYSVLHYVFAEGNVWGFFDRALELLAPGGTMLIGDVPNVSKRKRFFSSPAGIEFHKRFMQTDEPPDVAFNQPEPEKIDDAVIVGLLSRARSSGYDAYVLPLRSDLPLANRREDILVVRP